MNVKKFMTSDVHTVNLEMSVREAIEVLTLHKISGAPVIDANNRVISVISEGDLLKMAAAKLLDRKIGSCLSHLVKTEQLISLSVSHNFIDVYRLFIAKPVHRIIIMDGNGRLQGIVSRSNVLRIIVKSGKDLTEHSAA